MNEIQDSPTKIRESVNVAEELISQSVLIRGDVGSGSIIEATTLQVDGSTQKDSTQFARYGIINIHKGSLRCHKAKIAVLDGGEVHATKVNIQTCKGGSVYAQDVEIKEVTNNLMVYASNSISIDIVTGKDSQFKINYKDIPILNSKLELIREDLENLNYELKDATKHNVSQVAELNLKITTLEDEKSSILNSYKSAKISIQKPFNASNAIIFTINDETEITFKTKMEKYAPFFLEINHNKITLIPTNQTITL